MTVLYSCPGRIGPPVLRTNADNTPGLPPSVAIRSPVTPPSERSSMPSRSSGDSYISGATFGSCTTTTGGVIGCPAVRFSSVSVGLAAAGASVPAAWTNNCIAATSQPWVVASRSAPPMMPPCSISEPSPLASDTPAPPRHGTEAAVSEFTSVPASYTRPEDIAPPSDTIAVPTAIASLVQASMETTVT